jgi:2-dehydropantoate 2-reductase
LKRIAVVGVGAVGGSVAFHLARAGLAPTLIARPAQAEALAREGLTLLGAGVDETVRVAVASDARAAGPQDLVLVGFKGQDWPAGLAQVLPLLGPETALVPLLNGVPWWFFQGFAGPHCDRVVRAVDPDGALAAAIPARAVLGCVVYLASTREGPARIRWNGRKRLVLGEPSGGSSARLAAVTALLKGAGLDAEAADDIRAALWSKLLGNVTYNPLSVATERTMGAIVDDPGLVQVLRFQLAETIAVARALGVACDATVEERLTVSAPMRGFRTSMLQDFDAGRPLELGAIVDAVAELGRLVGVPTPVVETVGALAAARWMARWGG